MRLTVSATGRTARTLKRAGKVKLKVKVTFKATAGDITLTRRLTVMLRRS